MATPSSKHAVFGPVTSISTAPVSIGNSVCGAAPVVTPMRDGVRIQGRDFMFPLAAVNNAKTDWALVGGCPIIPHAFVASVMRNYASIYAEFVVHGLTFHFVTAAPTSTVGDVMFYINKNRGASLLDTTNTNFMSVVLSDPNTVLGPLWHNHSATYRPVLRKFSTAILDGEDLMHQGPGELFVYSKTSASSALGSPGYVLLDFDISFMTFQVNPRELTFPISRLKYNQYALQGTGQAVVAGSAFNSVVNGLRLDGTSTSIYNDSATRQGDVYKVVMMPDFGTYTNLSPSVFIQATAKAAGASFTAIPTVIDDGFTCYAVLFAPSSDGANAGLLFYPSYDLAMAQSVDCYQFGVTGTVSWNIPAWFSFVGSVGGSFYQSNF